MGRQNGYPNYPLVPNTASIGPDCALQLSTVWAAIDKKASTVASLPLFVFARLPNGQKELARTTRLWQVLHDSPNRRMAPFDFWRAMLLNYELRGNAYARIDRDPGTGEAIALWPMAADQVALTVLDDGSEVYEYRIGSDVAVLAAANVLHLRNLGNGTIGADKLAFMRASTDEAAKAITSASTVWGTSGKPTGALMLDHILEPEQRARLLANFADMAQGNMSRLFLLEASMKYQQISITPEQQQLLESRKFSVEELCRWIDVPPPLVYSSAGITLGSNLEQLITDGWYKLSIRPILVLIEQSLRMRVMTPRQRAMFDVEWSLDALLRANPKDRYDLYSRAAQNGLMTRNEIRQLENLVPMDGADELTAQTNLAPLSALGAMTDGGSNVPAQDPILQ